MVEPAKMVLLPSKYGGFTNRTCGFTTFYSYFYAFSCGLTCFCLLALFIKKICGLTSARKNNPWTMIQQVGKNGRRVASDLKNGSMGVIPAQVASGYVK